MQVEKGNSKQQPEQNGNVQRKKKDVLNNIGIFNKS